MSSAQAPLVGRNCWRKASAMFRVRQTPHAWLVYFGPGASTNRMMCDAWVSISEGTLRRFLCSGGSHSGDSPLELVDCSPVPGPLSCALPCMRRAPVNAALRTHGAAISPWRHLQSGACRCRRTPLRAQHPMTRGVLQSGLA